MSGSTELPSASGARLAGDDYQHLHSWLEALRLIIDGECVDGVSMEVKEAGNVDDLVLRCEGAATRYHQIKFGVHGGDPLTHTWFTTAPKKGAQTPLQRFKASFDRLSTPGQAAELVLVTNRHKDPADPLLKHVSGRDGTLKRAFASAPGSETGKVLTLWSEHLGIDQDDLKALLVRLEVRANQDSFVQLRSMCRMVMGGMGLRCDDAAMHAAVCVVRDLIIDGSADLDADALREILDQPAFKGGAKQGSLIVEAIDHFPGADRATRAVDWVDLFVGDEARSRRQLKDPVLWNKRLRPDLHAAAAAVQTAGYDSVLVAGALRLSTWLVAGEALSETKRFTVFVESFAGSVGSSAATPRPFATGTTVEEIGQGPGVALGLSVSGSLKEDALNYVRDQGLPVSRYIDLTPAAGPGSRSVADDAEAIDLARNVVDTVRGAAPQGDGMVHLFLYVPREVALFVGHLWNRTPATQLYDDLGPGRGYAPTYLIPE